MKQVKFINLLESAQTPKGGIMTHNGDIMCGCCGSTFPLDEEGDTWKLIHLWNTWINIEQEIAGTTDLNTLDIDTFDDDVAIEPDSPKQVIFWDAKDNRLHAGILFEDGSAVCGCCGGTLEKEDRELVWNILSVEDQWRDLSHAIIGESNRTGINRPDSTCAPKYMRAVLGADHPAYRRVASRRAQGRHGDYGIEFPHGNIHIRIRKRELAELLAQYRNDAFAVLSAVLDEFDTSFVGEPWSAGNFDMGYNLYNAHKSMGYRVYQSEVVEFSKTGKLRLDAFSVPECERAEFGIES